MSERVIAKFEYENGRFGTNHASLSRLTGEGYLLRNGYSDPLFVPQAMEAKHIYRQFKGGY